MLQVRAPLLCRDAAGVPKLVHLGMASVGLIAAFALDWTEGGAVMNAGSGTCLQQLQLQR